MTPRILIVDDDPITRRLFQHHLERAGYAVTVAGSGEEGMKAAFCELPQLIIIDVMMEEVDGLTVVRHLKTIPATKTIPIIVMTAATNGYAAFRQEAAMLGAAVFLTKPVGPAQLIAEVKKFIQPGRT